MTLPTPPLPTDLVVIADQEIKVRGLSRSEATRLRGMELSAAEVHVLACGCGLTETEAAEWLGSVLAEVAAPVLDRICELSGLVEGAQKSG